MKVMGIDASTRITGIAIYDGELEYWNALDFSKNKDYNSRSGDMMMAIAHEIVERKPDVVYIEDTFEKRGKFDNIATMKKRGKFDNIATMKKLCYIVGGVRMVCLTKHIPYNLILPSEWRKSIGISKGSRTERETFKERSLDYVKEKYGVTDVTDDVADAICIAEAGYILNSELFQ